MNMHVPQSVEAATELREIAAVPKQLISPRLSKPLVSVVQDTLVGVNRLTRPTEFFSRREYMNLLVHSKRWDGRIPPPARPVTQDNPVPMWSGQQVVSALLPAVYLAMGNKVWDEEKGKGDPNYVIINNGTITQGVLDADIFDKALIHILYNDFSPEMTVDFIDSLQAVVAAYLQNSGFSVGMSDLIADEGTLGIIATDMNTLKKQIESLQLQVHMGLFDNASGRTNQEEFEGKVFQTLDKVIGAAGKTGLKSLATNNRMVNMVKCGSKGADLNIAQMIALLGQQSIEGKRIAYGFQDRTLPHFKRYDDGAEARGFIESSFVKGLAPAEFFFHAMTGREGLIDTAVKSVTADTRIVIMEAGQAKTVRIGDWIDAHLAAREADVEYFPEEADLEMLQLNAATYIPSVAPDGTIAWGKVAAVTRHDPGNQLYRIETLGGRSVIVTASKSLLIWNPNTKLLEQRNTPDVRPGDCMPVTMVLPEPPVITSTINVASYLPKSEYLYGTDFHQAQAAVDAAMVERERVPTGWWAENNGKTFTLPYENKGRFVRTLTRSNTTNISSGYVYPFTSNRDGARIPDQLPLNAENGLFLGLFLAEGNVDVKSGYIGITNNSPEICQFVHDWFESHRINTVEESHVNAICGTSTTVRGFSTVLAKLLDAICGHGAGNKRVPAEAFVAPLDFVKGLLNGYFSGDGTVGHNSIESGSASQELTEGITMLLSRIGVFAKMFKTQLKSNNVGTENIQPTYRLSVRAQWASRLAESITFIDPAKEIKRLALRATAQHRNFTSQNDVVLDEIVCIESVSPDMYPKMYDLTVPETFTFGLANGLQVYDTADSGYMQRQLVKTMEDLVTWHDGSVRDVGGLLVQFAYGDDGTSATKIENQPIGLGKMSDTEIRAKFSVEDVGAEKSQAHLAQIFADRDILVQNVWNGRVEKTVQSAVHLPRLIANAVVQLGLAPFSAESKGTPVSGGHVLDTIVAIQRRTRPDNRLWGALLRFHLNPRDLVALGFTASAFDWLAEQIVVKHMKSWVAPGEMAGIIAAQSLGEPTTQMSSHKDTWISVQNIKNVSQSFTGNVGSFIDKIMTQNQGGVMRAGDSEALNMPPEWAIMGVSNDEKASWKPISQVSRHPANGGLVKVTTKSGRTTTATLSHSFLRRTTNGITEIKGSDLRVGQRIPVATRQPVPDDALKIYKGFGLTKDFGWLVGIYLADGSFNHNIVKISKIHPVVEERIHSLAEIYHWKVTVYHHKGAYGPSKDTNIHDAHLKAVLMELCNTGSFDKCLSAPVFHANKEFAAGLISGYFDGDGNVNAQRQQIRVGSRSRQLIRDIARLLPVCGVFGTLGEEKSINMPDQTMYTLNVLRKHAAIFQKEIGLHLTEKAAALQEIVAYNARTDGHSLKEEIDMIPELGDVIAETGRLLKMPGQSRTYGRYGSDRVVKKTAIGRRTLQAYIAEFGEMIQIRMDPAVADKVQENLAILESAATSDIIWDEITELEILDDPHELVYDFTVPGNDSFMVDDSIFVHNTLNSVDWDTEILIAKDGKIQAPRIGEFIDNYIAGCDRARIQQLPNDQLYVALDDGHDWQAVSCDEDGKMQWTKLEAITKHPVVNEDGTNTILEVTLESGRTVKATKGLSFLTLRDNKIVDLRGSDLKIGDLLPIANTLAIHEVGLIAELDMATVLPPTEWLYGTEVAKALAALKAADAGSRSRHWFSKANGTDFTVPYARSDSFRDAYTHDKNMHAANIRPGFIYPKKLWTKLTQIPAKIPLDREFGFFCGAYVAEGSTSPTQIQITNNDDAFLTPIRTLLDKWEIGHHTVSCDKTIAKSGIKGHTQSIVIHSTLLTAAMKAMFGAISYEKTLPDWVLQAPDDFVKGLIDGYFSGDGSVSKQRTINASSVSDSLITRLMALLTRYGIFATRSNYMPGIGKFNKVHRQYRLYVPQMYAYVFATTFTLTIAHKQERLNEIKKLNIHSKCRKPEFADMVMDRVRTIRDTLPKGGRMYDLTVEKTRNFLTLSCLAQKDTFHLSGVAAKSGMTRGVPRLKELLKVTQNPKATSLTIHLRPDLRKSKEEARRLAQELEFTMLKDLVTVSRIYYDPRDAETLVSEDAEWLSFFSAFEQEKPEEMSPWIIRLELDREKMFNKNITMEDVSFVLRRASAATPVNLTYTDHNATRMIFRIRLDTASTKKPPLDDLTHVKFTQNRLLAQTLVRGLPGLRSVSFRQMKDEIFEKNSANDNKYEAADQFVLDTFGTNFLDVLVHPDVDGTRLISNHVHDVYENLGIEAARMILFREIFGLFEQAAPVNYRHVAILCDAMCNRGRMMSADRYGVNKKKTGPLAKASFEQTEDIMLRAALFGEIDPVTGVSANIMTGQPIRGGTSFTQVLLDEAALQEFIAAAPARKMIERAPTLVQQQIDELLEAKEAPGCRQVDLRIPTALPIESYGESVAELPELEIQLID